MHKKINNILIDNAEDLDIIMSMYSLIQYRQNYSKTSGSLRNYFRDEPSSRIGGAKYSRNYSIKNLKFFNYKTSIKEKLKNSDATKEVEIAVPLKYLSNLWRTLDMSLIYCEASSILT